LPVRQPFAASGIYVDNVIRVEASQFAVPEPAEVLPPIDP